MKISTTIVFVLFSIPIFAQTIDSISFIQNAFIEQRHIPSAENKKIGLSYITSDIITFEQLLYCDELTLEEIPELEIISYDLLSFLPDNGGIKIFTGSGNKIPDTLIQEIISDGVSKILIENIIAFDHLETVSLGFRYFDLK